MEKKETPIKENQEFTTEDKASIPGASSTITDYFDPFYDADFYDEELEKAAAIVDGWLTKYSESTPSFKNSSNSDKELASGIIMDFTEFMILEHGLLPEEWNEKELEKCCLYTMIERVIEEEEYFSSIGPILIPFFEFLEKNNLSNNTDKLAKKLSEIEGDIVKRSKEPKNWGKSKVIIMEAVSAGIDITDEKAVNDYIKSKKNNTSM